MRITIFGSGYVGLVTGACLADAGNHVVCVDVDRRKVDMLNRGEVPIHEPGLDEVVQRNFAAGRLRFTTEAKEAVDHGQFQLIAVGTPPDEDGSADLRSVLAVARTIGTHMTEYKVVITKSTVPVGTADKVHDAVAESLKARAASIEFDLVSNPEFLKEGAAIEDFMKPDRVIVGTSSARAAELMRTLYEPFTRNRDRMIVMDVRSAELTKYAANAMLATKISFMNELANLAEHCGADIESVRIGIGSDPRIGHAFIYPGVGYGGSCFPKDVKALKRSAHELGYQESILSAVEAVNERQKTVLFNKIKAHFGVLKNKTIALWGLAFKPNTDDMREAASRVLMEALWKEGVKVRAYDPVAMPECERIYGKRADLTLCKTGPEALEGADALAIVTEWREFRSPDFGFIRATLKAPVIFDGRNLYDPVHMARDGFSYYAIGRGKQAGERITMTILPVILSGGAGTRLWPLSREMYPKQLLALTGKHTMLQDTVARLAAVEGSGDPIIVCNEAHRFTVAEQIRAMGYKPGAILLEPAGRNTAPAVALAALQALKIDPKAILLVAPADHVVRDTRPFQQAAAVAAALAAEGKLVTFGIVAHAPETGYGYIRRGDGQGPAYPVAQFIEKPPLDVAQQFVASGDYFWNSGMFVFTAERYLAELASFAPDILEASSAAFQAATTDLDFVRIDKSAFEKCRSDSIDYAVMEKTRSAVVLPLDAGWSDVGSWASLFDALPADEDGNVLKGDALVYDTHDCYVHSTSRLVTAVGMDDHVIVETKDAVLVAPKDRVQDVKELVAKMKKSGRGESSLHREVFRPWGSYDSLDAGERFQVKRLSVKPGGVLSLQMHHHRAEHWIVVQGTARITCGEKTFLLSENESTYIPIGATHRIENPGKVPLHIVEVQSGSYLGEDDIVRFEDNYGRQGTDT